MGLDIHRNFGEAVEIRDGVAGQLGRIDLVHHRAFAFSKRFGPEAEVVIEATGNTAAIAKVIAPHAKRVLIANPSQVRAIAHAKVKTGKIDALTPGQAVNRRGTLNLPLCASSPAQASSWDRSEQRRRLSSRVALSSWMAMGGQCVAPINSLYPSL